MTKPCPHPDNRYCHHRHNGMCLADKIERCDIMTKPCPECAGGMIIDEWNGWVWVCPFCDYGGDPANDVEIKEWESGQYGIPSGNK